MRVTKELSAKIERTVKEKYTVLITEAKRQFNETYYNEKTELSNQVYEIVKENPVLERYFSSCVYGTVNESSIKSIIREHLREACFISASPNKEQLSSLEAEVKRLESERNLLIEDLKIKISYVTDLKQIVEFFSNAGLQF